MQAPFGNAGISGVIGRFAPTPSGQPHPGTLLSALLVWLDARSRGGRVFLRLEDLDRGRCQPEWDAVICESLTWLGLDWDSVERQQTAAARHDAALRTLAMGGRLYECTCSRAELARLPRTEDGTPIYDGRCRARQLTQWPHNVREVAVRVRLDSGITTVADESGQNLSQDVVSERGDPIVVRRDGAVAYMLAVVVDDVAVGVTRVVRGRDIAPSTATQVALYHLLAGAQAQLPVYRHHLLLLEARDQKLAKLHGSMPFAEVRAHTDGPQLCGQLAWAAGLMPTAVPLRPRELLDGFAWSRVRNEDRLATWDGQRLTFGP